MSLLPHSFEGRTCNSTGTSKMHLTARHSIPSHTHGRKARFGEIATQAFATDLSLLSGHGNLVGGQRRAAALG